MISRVAEDCFWMARYLERVETLARVLHVNLAFQLDVRLPEAERWRPLVIVLGLERDFAERIGEADVEKQDRVLEYLTWDRENPASLWSSLYWARENARTVREAISRETWETINELWLWLESRTARLAFRRDPHAFFLHLRDRCVLFQGFALTTMLVEEAFDFLRLGTALERATQTARILDIKYHSLGPTEPDVETPAETAQWLAILRCCAGIEPFYKRCGYILSGRTVAGFLLLERSFPRSVLHNLDRARNFLALIREPAPPEIGAGAEKTLRVLLSAMEKVSIQEILERSIHAYLTYVVDSIGEIGGAVERDFFRPPAALTPAQRQAQSSAGRSQEQRA